MKFKETLGDLRRRQMSGEFRKPLRTFKELCADIGVPERTVLSRMKRADAPKPKVRHRSAQAGQRSYYDPSEFFAWWESLK